MKKLPFFELKLSQKWYLVPRVICKLRKPIIFVFYDNSLPKLAITNIFGMLFSGVVKDFVCLA